MSQLLRVLMVEDDPNDAELLLRHLRTGGYTPATERTERLADVKAALDNECWDVVLCDHSMPGFRSGNVLALIKERVEPPPVIVVSGAMDEHQAVDAILAGAAGVVEKGCLARLVPMIEEVRERLRLQHERTRRELELVRAAVDSTSELIGIIEARPSGALNILFVNGSCAKMTGYGPDELIVRGPRALVGPKTNLRAIARMKRAIARAEGVTAEWLMYRNDGAATWVETEIRQIAGASNRFVCATRDITERKNAEAHVAILATHDSLTGLANRVLLGERLERDLLRTRRTGACVAVLVIDVDGFKDVNDSLGHSRGDELLRETARRLCSCVREADTVARIGGDEFVVVLADAVGPDTITAVARRILDCTSRPVDLHGERRAITLSIGIAMHPANGESADALIRGADLAMYHVKSHGKNGYHFAGARY